MRTGFVCLTVALMLLGFAAIQFSGVKPTVCSHLGKLIDVDRDRIVRARDEKLLEAYYVSHVSEANAYRDRTNAGLVELEQARC